VIEARIIAERKARKAAKLLKETMPQPSDPLSTAPSPGRPLAIVPRHEPSAPPSAAASPGRPPAIVYVAVPSHSPLRPKYHVYFDQFKLSTNSTHEATFRAAVTLSPKYRATVRSPSAAIPTNPEKCEHTPVRRRTKLLRPPPKFECSNVEVQTDCELFKRSMEIQTETQHPLTLDDLRTVIKTELEHWLGFLVHLH
jgi:hypothetical protein